MMLIGEEIRQLDEEADYKISEIYKAYNDELRAIMQGSQNNVQNMTKMVEERATEKARGELLQEKHLLQNVLGGPDCY